MFIYGGFVSPWFNNFDENFLLYSIKYFFKSLYDYRRPSLDQKSKQTVTVLVLLSLLS